MVPAVPQQPWKKAHKIVFRIFFLYFLLQVIPLDPVFWQQLFSISWSNLHYGDIFNLAHYQPRFFGSQQHYGNWAIIFIIALMGAITWTYFDRNKTREYSVLYYWIRVLVRYRLAIALLAYGMIKLFPLQAPYPSISNLNTAYGDFNRWKLFSLTLGIVPSYQAFLGLVEIVFALLLLYRKTATISAFMIVIFTGNVYFSNLAYEGGEHVYSLYLLSFALFLLVFDLQRIISLVILQRATRPNTFKPVFIAGWLRNLRLPLKAAVVFFFFVLYGFKTATNYRRDPYQYPTQPGLTGVAGLYNVAAFRINNTTLAYDKTDPIRWQDVVFEKWNTISIKSNRPVVTDSTNIDQIVAGSGRRNYELEGSKGRHYYSYEVDSTNNLLILHNKNPHYPNEKIVLQYNGDRSRIQLRGIDYNNDSVFVTLHRVNKKYLVQEAAKQGRRSGLKL
ncbi:DoxX family protein [Segetibacter sp. 3557_3]|nr:DoxX family protein [Segetibacter sp. 3557_3]